MKKRNASWSKAAIRTTNLFSMKDNIEIGDYVEVDLGMGLAAIGVVVTEDQYKAALREYNVRNRAAWVENCTISGYARSKTTYKIRFIDGSTHTAIDYECRKLTGKELFKAKLSNDKRIYEI